MLIKIPEFSLVVLIGASGSGKSTFAARHFLPTEIISSDTCRGWVSDDPNSQEATQDAFDILHAIAAKRLKNKKLTVIDATNVQAESRKSLVRLARDYHAQLAAIVLDLPERVCVARNRERPDRSFGRAVVARQRSQLRRSLRSLKREGFRYTSILHTESEVGAVEIERTRLWNDKTDEHGPFDIIGDVHGCYDELAELLHKLGYVMEGNSAAHPQGRRAIFLGDLVDRGPGVVKVLNLVMNMVRDGRALCVPGNHDVKLVRALRGKKVRIAHGLDKSLEQLADESDETKKEVAEFLDRLISHYVLDDGRLIVAHAGMKEELAGRASGKVRSFALYGETTGETDEFGLPERINWAADYRGRAKVVYGHTPVARAQWLNSTINIDTGCVFGGALTALRYPEDELVAVAARETYADPIKPLRSESTLTSQQEHDDFLDIADVIGKRIVDTGLLPRITIRAENSAAALEVMSRFAVDPRWLVYLPPTMSPTKTSRLERYLEYPDQPFDYYRSRGVEQVICEEKHMGSRAVVIVCRYPEAAHTRFGVANKQQGIVYTRTGRRFFTDIDLEAQLIKRVGEAVEAAGLWEELKTEWLLLDCELMPWSAKAQGLLREQYAAVGAAGQNALSDAAAVLAQTAGRGLDVAHLQEQIELRRENLGRYIDAYGHYCWPVDGLEDMKLAPFHLLASEGAVHSDKDHRWHMETLGRICAAAGDLLLATPYKIVNVDDPISRQEAVTWWETMTTAGGEGMVVKPLDFIKKDHRGLLQPAIKCRGPEYLRIIYGPEYTAHINRLRKRALRPKRSLAIREFALGLEALARFVARQPLRRVHECVFGVLALESEPVDPRL
ncbi:MAG: polynucleotide kinase-phosphatase [Ardenticatenaceae bacterium]|nr:polynucleotide kinase-phosphatase [Ardenticatenaceae bacterium]